MPNPDVVPLFGENVKVPLGSWLVISFGQLAAGKMALSVMQTFVESWWEVSMSLGWGSSDSC
jgi:hypothetical protein